MADLAICMVSCCTDGLVDANWRLTAALNDDMPAQWIVAENTPPGQPGAVSSTDERYQVVPGVTTEEMTRWNGSWQHGLKCTSHAHGHGLNLSFAPVKTRYALFLDPDFCIVVPQWCKVIPEYMERNNLAFFGAPYQPEMWRKYRYFPAAFCLFVDLQQVPPGQLDLRPLFRPKTWLSKTIERRFQRLLIGRSTDVGWDVFARHAGGPLRNEVVQGSWKNTHASGALRSMLRALMPDRYVILPKKPGYGTEQTFVSAGFPDPMTMGKLTDEYFWQGKPFAFHIRSRIQSGDMERLPSFVMEFASPEVLEKFGVAPNRYSASSR